MDKQLKQQLQETANLARIKGNNSIESLCYAIKGAGESHTEALLAGHVCEFLENVLQPLIKERIAQSEARKN